MFVRFFPVHADRIEALRRVFSGDWVQASPAGNLQNIGVLAIAGHMGVADPSRAGTMLEYRRAGSVSEKDAGVAVGPVDDG